MLQPDPNERFRLRRQQARRRRAVRRIVVLAVLVVAAAVIALGARFLTPDERASGVGHEKAKAARTTPAKPQPRPLPPEMRGIHVTMALPTLPGKLNEYLSYSRYGLNTLELDVKDENGKIAFPSRYAPLARRIGAAGSYYRPQPVARRVHDRGLYLIARVVVFEDPLLASKRPNMAIRRSDGGVWTNYSGLAWANPYDRRVWHYNVDVAESAARAGFDEIMFDYVRFPSDGPIEDAVFPGRGEQRMAPTIARFLAYARNRLNPLGVRVSAAVFGLSATRNLGIGQRPSLLAPYLDVIYPMVYPSHFGAGEYGIQDPAANPAATITMSLRTFRRALRGSDTKLVPWLQDFTYGRRYTSADVEAQINAARRMRAGGYLLWNAGGVYTLEVLER
ncbi:MAG: putative glycoside hydrolase [Actinomycetota bacterium]|nr:putative glycoside hydrolase [Actinomycetota bacterium]